jgi:hypothetical protein
MESRQQQHIAMRTEKRGEEKHTAGYAHAGGAPASLGFKSILVSKWRDMNCTSCKQRAERCVLFRNYYNFNVVAGGTFFSLSLLFSVASARKIIIIFPTSRIGKDAMRNFSCMMTLYFPTDEVFFFSLVSHEEKANCSSSKQQIFVFVIVLLFPLDSWLGAVCSFVPLILRKNLL